MSRMLSSESSLAGLKREAKRWLRALADDATARARFDRAHPAPPGVPTLRDVQLALAREYGFDGWSALKRAAEAISRSREHVAHETANPDPVARAERVTRFLRNACRDWRSGGGFEIGMARGTASRLLEQYPELALTDIFCAVACGHLEATREFLARDPSLANAAGGPRDWTPLLYLAAARLEQPEATTNAVEIARVLLDAGADPNAFYPGGGSAIRYTVLTCVLGRGEEASPPHPRERELAALLLDAGAEPLDTQVLYNVFADHASRRMLTDDITWLLDLMYEHSVRRGDALRWRDPSLDLLDIGGYGPGAFYLLKAAVDRGLPRLADWVLAHGGDPNVRPRNPTLYPHTLYEYAAFGGNTEMIQLLERHGAIASTPTLEPWQRLLSLARRDDVAATQTFARAHPRLLQDPRLLSSAVIHDDARATRLLLDLGVSPGIVNPASGTSGPLHDAAWAGATRAGTVLLERGADPDARERHYNATPLSMAIWAQQPAMVALIGAYSRDVFRLSFVGNVARLRTVLASEPALARSTRDDGDTALMWLPDDAAAATEIVALLLAAGADPTARDAHGITAAEKARRRALVEAALLLEHAAARASHVPHA